MNQSYKNHKNTAAAKAALPLRPATPIMLNDINPQGRTIAYSLNTDDRIYREEQPPHPFDPSSHFYPKHLKHVKSLPW